LTELIRKAKRKKTSLTNDVEEDARLGARGVIFMNAEGAPRDVAWRSKVGAAMHVTG
jgi:hypothetical protein